MIQKLREILEKQSVIISKQKKLILKLNDELRKRNLKSEEVALVLQGVTLGLKNARKGFSFWSSFDAQSISRINRLKQICKQKNSVSTESVANKRILLVQNL